jgi:hypothetical protein
VDYELLKYIVRWGAIGVAVGFGGVIVFDRLGFSWPVGMGILFVGWCAYMYTQAKAEQKAEQERITAVWQEGVRRVAA